MKVGIVVVSYNASLAVRVTLASVRRAKTDVPYELVLVDNASAPPERWRIEKAFDLHRAAIGDSWTFMAEATNLGFSGGNNVGIQRFIDRPDISHICLLNSDVIVPDHWLDRLVQSGTPIVSAVTNKADSEQCVPIDYALKLADCLDAETESLAESAAGRVNQFADGRYRAFRGCLVETDVTFFCVLIERKAMATIGLLDETFFPGGYEDNDYCLRARAAGYPLHLSRDCYIHHWGSASFGQLQHEYFSERAQRNIHYLEEKHGIRLERHPEKPLVSYENDFSWALRADPDPNPAYLRRTNALYRDSLTQLLTHYRSEFQVLSTLAAGAPPGPFAALRGRIQGVKSAPDPVARFAALTSQAEALLAQPVRDEAAILEWTRNLGKTTATVHEMAVCNLEIHAELKAQGAGAPPAGESDATAPSMLHKLGWLTEKCALFLWGFRGIVFFGGYPYPERQSDGYFQRIQIVDGLFTDFWRIYVESTELPGRDRWFDQPAERVLVLRVLGGPWRKVLVRTLAVLAVLRCRRIYFHSVLRMRDQRFGQLLRLPWLIRAIDIHGVVPEEFRFHNDFYSATLYDREERLAVGHADLTIVVSEAMHGYLRQKYPDTLKARVAIFPMFPALAADADPHPYRDGRPTVVYAGGLHRWQQVPKMIDAIERTADRCDHRFYTGRPEEVRALLSPALRERVVVGGKGHAELMDLYRECHFGFLLREDVVVNHVACPTKAVEYFAKGIVPIVDTENIGDFKALGMQFLSLADFLAGRLPDAAERDAMAQANIGVYERLRKQRDSGARAIYELFAYPKRLTLRQRLKRQAARWLPPSSRRGRLARRIARALSFAPAPQTECPATSEPLDLSGIPQGCDILMQVDNFIAGGLENVVLDLDRTLAEAGYRVVLAVLGQTGAAVERARRQGTPVVVLGKCPQPYAELLAHLKPRLALTHYSTFGAEACAVAGIPFVQVIHNTYMWLSPKQLDELRASTRFTTGFVAVSDYAHRYSIARLGVDPHHCMTIPNGIDIAHYSVQEARAMGDAKRAELGIAPDDYVFLAVGSINHQKNHLAAVQAFATADLPNTRLVILGPPYERALLAELQQYINAKGLGGRILYAGSAPSAQSYYAMADAFLSSAYFEGGQLTLLEALAANLSVVTTEIGFALHFRGLAGVEVIAPPFDIVDFHGSIVEMAFGGLLVEQLASAMRRTYTDRRRPDLPPGLIESFDKRNTYACYLSLISTLVNGQGWESVRCKDGWPERVRVYAQETTQERA